MKKLLLAGLALCVIANAEPRRIRTSDGFDLYVQVKGQGAPCLYIHGGPGCRADAHVRAGPPGPASA